LRSAHDWSVCCFREGAPIGAVYSQLVLGGRSAVFVDVGYLLGTAGRTLLNTTYRHYIRCDYRALVARVIANVEEHSGMSVLPGVACPAARRCTAPGRCRL
jgi:hypothetical protein